MVKKQPDKQDKSTVLRQRAEAKAGNRPLTTLTALPLAETEHLLHELQVHQIELEMQNEELRRTQLQLESARARYFDLYDLAPVGYLTIDEKGLILEANLTAVALLGSKKSALVQQRLTQFIEPDDQDIFYLQRKQMLPTGAPQMCELRIRNTGETAAWVQLTMSLAQDVDGTPIFRVILNDISALKQAEQTLRAALAEREVLLKEVHHRVKNNLASIVGLISLQQFAQPDPTVAAELEILGERIHAMALVHELLYQNVSLSRVDMQNYLMTLVGHLKSSYDTKHKIFVTIAAPGVEMNLDNAIYSGLIVNELVTNAFKYAFSEGRPASGDSECSITVTVTWDGEVYTLRVSDNGAGLPAGFDWKTTHSLGLQLVFSLSQTQLHGQVRLENNNGTAFQLTFAPKKQSQASPSKAF